MTHRKKWTATLLITCLLVPSSFASWRVNVNPWRERRQDDIASVQVAVQSVAPFDDYVESLQPHYAMDEKLALTEAVPLTRTQGTAEFSALLASLTARGQDVTSSLSRETDTDNKGTTTTDKRTDSKQPGSLTDVAAPPAHVDRTLAAPLPAGDTEVDPSMKYAAATALMQRVSLMSNYVRDAAVRMHTKPYLVRLLVTVSPTAATRGYDAYTTVSFFSTAKGPDGQDLPRSLRVNATRFAKESRDRFERARAALNEICEAKTSCHDAELSLAQETENIAVLDAAESNPCDETPLETIPLLVTDTVSASLHADSYERMRELALALQGMASNARISSGLRSQNDRLSNTLTRDFNGVMTVSRAAENSIEVRLGAMFGNREDALVPRTYDVTALVLFPLANPQSNGSVHDLISNEVVPCSMAFYTAQTTFRNSQNGKVARPGNHSSLMSKVSVIVTNAGIPTDIADKLISDAQQGNYRAFVSRLPSEFQNTATASLLWPRVVGVVARDSFSRGMFQAPVREVDFFTDQANGTVFDDGKQSTLTLVGSRNILADRIMGLLKVTTVELPPKAQVEPQATKAESKKVTKKVTKTVVPAVASEVASKLPPKDGPTFYLPANSVAVGTDGRFAKLTFDSVNKRVKKGCEVKKVYAVVSYAKGARDWEREIYTSRWPVSNNGDMAEITYVSPGDPEKESKPSRFTISTGARTILATNGSGSIVISMKRGEIAKGDEANATVPMLFSVVGADIVSAENLIPIGSDWGSAKDGVWKVTLANLIVATPVTIHAWSGTGKTLVAETDIPLQVQALDMRNQHHGE